MRWPITICMKSPPADQALGALDRGEEIGLGIGADLGRVRLDLHRRHLDWHVQARLELGQAGLGTDIGIGFSRVGIDHQVEAGPTGCR